MRNKCIEMCRVFAVFFTVFACWLCFKLFQEVVVFLPMCIVPRVLECEMLSADGEVNFLLSGILLTSCQYTSSFRLPREFFGYSNQ